MAGKMRRVRKGINLWENIKKIRKRCQC